MSDIYIARKSLYFRGSDEKRADAVKGIGAACVRIPYKAYEISIACDDSCGAFEDLRRSEIRIFKDEKDVTGEIMTWLPPRTPVYGDATNLRFAMEAIDHQG
jgi:hypothetical protein